MLIRASKSSYQLGFSILVILICDLCAERISCCAKVLCGWKKKSLAPKFLFCFLLFLLRSEFHCKIFVAKDFELKRKAWNCAQAVSQKLCIVTILGSVVDILPRGILSESSASLERTNWSICFDYEKLQDRFDQLAGGIVEKVIR